MADPRHIAVLIGSLRTESFNRRLALALAAMAPPQLASRSEAEMTLTMLNAIRIRLPLLGADLLDPGARPLRRALVMLTPHLVKRA